MAMRQALSTLLLSLLLGPAASQNGEEACEERGYGRQQCLDVGCCQFEEGQCWSAVQRGPCVDPSTGRPGSGGRGEPILQGLEGWSNGQAVWHSPPSGWGSCGRVTTVFGIGICISRQAWATGRARADHIANVFHQLIDNDGDGRPDDPAVLSRMVNNGYLLWVPDGEADNERNAGRWPDDVGPNQMSGVHEAFPNNCQAPVNRGADPTNRSTWPAAVSNSRGCDTRRDASTEEILHLITHAAAEEYPDLWGMSFRSEVGVALREANGNCGHGYLGNWIDPSSGRCTGQHAYNDETCDERCNVVEGLYWAVTSYIGGLYTTTQTGEISNEWLMATPDANMPVWPRGTPNAVSLEAGSPALYRLVSDTTSRGHAWLPAVMPDGRYRPSEDFDSTTTTEVTGANPTESTGAIPDPSCEDGSESCEAWATAGECGVNPTYMLTNCARSCNTCESANPLEPTPESADNDAEVETEAPTQGSTAAPTAAPTMRRGQTESTPPREIAIDWIFPGPQGLPPVSANVGDTLVFTWGGVHNVYIAPSNSCNNLASGANLGASSPVRYTVQAGDEGGIVFACEVPGHCQAGMLLPVDVGQSSSNEGSGATPDPSCQDGNEFCEAWATAGECDVNPTYMLTNCAWSCDECRLRRS